MSEIVVLAQEIDAGRYASFMSLEEGEEFVDKCNQLVTEMQAVRKRVLELNQFVDDGFDKQTGRSKLLRFNPKAAA